MTGYFYLRSLIQTQHTLVPINNPMFRLIHQRHIVNPLRAVPAPSRFSDPNGNYAVLYGAATVSCCLWENVVRNSLTRRQHREILRSDITSRRVVLFQSQQDLNLVDLREDGPVRIGAPPDVVHDSNHHEGRLLSTAFYTLQKNVDGFLYSSRFTGEQCYAIFDRAFHKLNQTGRVTQLTQRPSFWQALNHYKITLI